MLVQHGGKGSYSKLENGDMEKLDNRTKKKKKPPVVGILEMVRTLNDRFLLV